MAFYDLSKEDRAKLVKRINDDIHDDLVEATSANTTLYFSDADTYIRKSAYLAMGRIYKSHERLQKSILDKLGSLIESDDEKVRQTAINTAGEIGMSDFQLVMVFFDEGLFDPHHSVRNAVIGSVKKMGQRNPEPVLRWAEQYLEHPDKEIRREICHGIELRGRTHPEDVLPLLERLQHDKTARVRNTLVHVLGQIAYKKGCLQAVVGALNKWKNKELVRDALDEIVDVHDRYKSFAIHTQEEAIAYIDENYEA